MLLSLQLRLYLNNLKIQNSSKQIHCHCGLGVLEFPTILSPLSSCSLSTFKSKMNKEKIEKNTQER